MVFILINEYNLRETGQDIFRIGMTASIMIVTLLVNIYGGDSPSKITGLFQLFLLGLYTVSVLGMTIFQWDTLSNKEGKECGILIPHSDNFGSKDYLLYRVIYLITAIFLVSILQFKIDDRQFVNYLPGFIEKYLHFYVFLIPFIFPPFTELITKLVNVFMGSDDSNLNPESLLSNFIFGDYKESFETDGYPWLRSIFPLSLYAFLMFMALFSSMGYIGRDGGNSALTIIVIWLIFFSFFMRSIFVQDCSLESSKNVSKVEENSEVCFLEKYGGLQTMLSVCLIIIVIYHIDKPQYKVFVFVIICLGSWALSTTYILNTEREKLEGSE
jgi:hypothetical protein